MSATIISVYYKQERRLLKITTQDPIHFSCSSFSYKKFAHSVANVSVRFQDEVAGQIQGVTRGFSIYCQFKTGKPWIIRQQSDNFLSPLLELFWRLAISKNNCFGLTRHAKNRGVIVRPDGVIDLQQPVFIGDAIGIKIADQLTAIAPCTRELTSLSQGRVSVVPACNAGIHENPQDKRLTCIPNLCKLIAILPTLGKTRRDGGICRPGRAGFPTRIMNPLYYAH